MNPSWRVSWSPSSSPALVWILVVAEDETFSMNSQQLAARINQAQFGSKMSAFSAMVRWILYATFYWWANLTFQDMFLLEFAVEY